MGSHQCKMAIAIKADFVKTTVCIAFNPDKIKIRVKRRGEEEWE